GSGSAARPSRRARRGPSPSCCPRAPGSPRVTTPAARAPSRPGWRWGRRRAPGAAWSRRRAARRARRRARRRGWRARAAPARRPGALEPAALAGSVVIVPVLRPGGRFAPQRGSAPPWQFPGDAGGNRRERDAFTVFSEVAVGAGALLVLGGPRGGRVGAVTA